MGRVDAINKGMAELSPLASVDVPSLEGRVSAEEWKIRVDLAAASGLSSAMPWLIASTLPIFVPPDCLMS